MRSAWTELVYRGDCRPRQVTPYAVSRYVLDHLPPFEGRATLKLYRGGHMFYLDSSSRKAFTADASAIY